MAYSFSLSNHSLVDFDTLVLHLFTDFTLILKIEFGRENDGRVVGK
jgi:hypothetical protein